MKPVPAGFSPTNLFLLVAVAAQSSSLSHLWNGTANPVLLCKGLFGGNMGNTISTKLGSPWTIPAGHSIPWSWTQHSLVLDTAFLGAAPKHHCLCENFMQNSLSFCCSSPPDKESWSGPFCQSRFSQCWEHNSPGCLTTLSLVPVPCSGAWRYFVAADAII